MSTQDPTTDDEPTLDKRLKVTETRVTDEAPDLEQLPVDAGPTTAEARDRLREVVYGTMRAAKVGTVDSPTSLGKSYRVAATPWRDYPEVTGGEPVVMLSKTTDARDEAAEKSKSNGVSHHVLKGRDDLCTVAQGNHDDQITMNGEPASEWIDRQCDHKGMTFADAHAHLADHNDRSRGLPCCEGDSDCPAASQWSGVPRDDNDEPSHDVIHATHQFAFVPGLIGNTNVVGDEQPDFAVMGPGATDGGKKEKGTDVSNYDHDDLRRALNAYLEVADAPLESYSTLVTIAADDGYPTPDDLGDALTYRPDHDWFFAEPDAISLAPALTRAVWRAASAKPDANGRRVARYVEHYPPRLDADERGRATKQWVNVVLDDTNTITTLRAIPNLDAARSVIGLDAHPSWPLWAVNTGPGVSVKRVLERDEREAWRRQERGLKVVQVGDYTRQAGGDGADYLNESKCRVLIQFLRERHGEDFRTAVCPKKWENRVETMMQEAGIDDPEVIHYGEEKSNNDFEGEGVGLVLGCIDPGDDYVLDILAELDLDAEPETNVCGTCDGEGTCITPQCDDGIRRAQGRGFVGPDAELAAEALASVRESHVAQAAGRYARNLDDPDDSATVYVWTDVLDSMVDVEIEGVETDGDEQREMADYLRENRGSTRKEVVEGVECGKSHVYKTIDEFESHDRVAVDEDAGHYNADEYRWIGGDVDGTVDMTPTD